MKKFDTHVQEIKYWVLREVARLAFQGRLELKDLMDLPEKIIPGPKAESRCCIYKERAIVAQRIQMAMGGHEEHSNEVEVLSIACDECPVSEISVGDACRGCIAHRCANACPRDAIHFEGHRAVIDHAKCVMCGKCVAVCPYGAITKNTRPCERACKAGAIAMDDDRKAAINEEKCVNCGACVYQCPFGAIVDKSYMLDAIDLLHKSQQREGGVYAVVAPSISGQFGGVKIGQIAAALKKMGFYTVIEAALGADMVAYKEARELAEKGFLTSSCCPGFVSYIEKNFPKMIPHISHNPSPMAQMARVIKKAHPEAKVVFIGPCVAKKAERKKETVRDWVDCVLTFEELQAMIDALDIDLQAMPDEDPNNASYYGRIFARSGGLSEAVVQALKEQAIDFEAKAAVCSGLEECKLALLKASKGILPENFIEGMACEQGCIGGAACLTHGPKEKAEVDKYGRLAIEKNIKDAIAIFDILNASKEDK